MHGGMISEAIKGHCHRLLVSLVELQCISKIQNIQFFVILTRPVSCFLTSVQHTGKSELYNSLTTLRLTLRFWLNIGNILL